MKTGDKVKILETNPAIPDGFWYWDGEITDVQDSFIQTKHERTPEPWLEELTKNLAGCHRTYLPVYIRHFKDSEGKIDTLITN